MSEAEPSGQLRASDRERERAAELLREAMASGRLSVDELDERMRLVFDAKTRPELERLVGDVIVPADDRHPIAAQGAEVASDGPRPPVRAGAEGTRRVLSILSGSERKGRWRLAPTCSVVNVLGGSELDLSDAELAAERVELKIFTLLGGAKIVLPDGLDVEISEVAILGGNAIDVGDEQPGHGGPVVHLRLVTILGGVEVRRRSRVEREQRTQLKRSQRELDD
ncbi:MAG TPA: DUF1707 domain-containing protein [Solirubrobacteraceae bacterium]|nr:DUF1707 domain-containing protein [Solirubrobacteraceae bacterium]